MRFAFRLFIAGMLASFAAVGHSAPITYDIAFTQTLGSTLPTGSFIYDSGTGQFSSLVVRILGADYDLTASANSPQSFGCGVGATGFEIMSGQTACQTEQVWATVSSTTGVVGLFASANALQSDTTSITTNALIAQQFSVSFNTPERVNGGTFTISSRAETVPEPATLALVGLALGAAGLASRRRA